MDTLPIHHKNTRVPAQTHFLVGGKEPQGIGLRICATIIDTVLIWLSAFTLARFFQPTSTNIASGHTFLWFFVIVFYYIIMEWKCGGTVGKLIFGLRVVMLDGKSCTFIAAFLRTIMRLFDGILCYLVAVIAVSVSEKKQRLGDMVAGTVVIKK